MNIKTIFKRQSKEKMAEILLLLSRQSDKQEEQMKKLTEIEGVIRKVQTKQSKQEDVLEEIFDTIEEHGEAFDKQEAVRSREGNMLTLLIAYDEALGQAIKYTEKHEETKELSRQIADSMNRMKQSMQMVGIIKIDKTGIPIDYGIHELIEIEDTNDFQLKDKVSQIILPGWSLENKVVKKANVIAYKYREDRSEWEK